VASFGALTRRRPPSSGHRPLAGATVMIMIAIVFEQLPARLDNFNG
jgi:hypothetical protein